MQIKIVGTEEGLHLWPKRLPFWCLCFSRHKQFVTKLTPCQIKYHRVMLSVWWDFKGIVYFELFPRNQTINSNVFSRQLMKLDKEMKEKWPELAICKGVIFYQDYVRPHISLVIRKKILELGWEVIIIYTVYFITIWMEKHSIQMRLSKMSWFSFSPLRTKLSTKAEL